MRKNILILGHDYTTQFVDIFNQYSRIFDKDKYAVTVAYLTGEPSDEIKERTLADEVIFLNIPKRKIRSLKIGAIKTLLALTRKKQFQIVICHRYKPSYIMMWVAKFYKIPLVISVMHELRTMTSMGRKLLIAGIASKNVSFAGVSNAVRDDMRKSLWFIPKNRIVTLYNMIDVEMSEPQLFSRIEAREQLQLAQDDFIFGNLGRLVKNKDHVTLIKAFAEIKPHCANAKLLILGSGELESSLKQLVDSLNLGNDVIFTGFIKNGFRYMKAFDCFVLSSIQEAFGRVLLEAMIAKLPVIATRVHGIPEVMGNMGQLIEARDIEGLGKAMQDVYGSSADIRAKQGENAYQYVVNTYSIPVFREQFWRLFA